MASCSSTIAVTLLPQGFATVFRWGIVLCQLRSRAAHAGPQLFSVLRVIPRWSLPTPQPRVRTSRCCPQFGLRHRNLGLLGLVSSELGSGRAKHRFLWFGSAAAVQPELKK
jgi:hypothetical protein